MPGLRGGRVLLPIGGRWKSFFDELGPPWPKHPCTDNSSVPGGASSKVVTEINNFRSDAYKWQVDGWSPFFISSISRIDKKFLRIKGEYNDIEKSIYASKTLTVFGDPVPITEKSIAYLREGEDGQYQLSFITAAFSTPVTISAFSSLHVARHVQPVNVRKVPGGQSADTQKLARYRRGRREVESFLALVVRSEVTGGKTPRLPRHLRSRLQAAIASRGGLLEWARSRPEYSAVKRQERSKLRRADRSRRKRKTKRRMAPAENRQGKH